MTTKQTNEAIDVDDIEKLDNESVDDTAEAGKNDQTATEPGTATAARDGIIRRSVRVLRRRRGTVLLVAALVVPAAIAAWLQFQQYRPDRQTDDATATVALNAAKDGTVALLSYSPDSLDKDFAAAKSHLTGDFLSYYTQFTEQIVKPAAKQKSVKTSATIARAAVSELRPNSAVVLVFVNQDTTSKENPDHAFAASSVKVGLKRINDAWLISSFDPV